MSPNEDPITNDSANPHLLDLIESRLQDASRRTLLRGGLGAATLGFLGGATGLIAGCGGGSGTAAAPPPPAPTRPASLGFAAVPKSLEDRVIVPDGYRATVLFRLGDPLAANVPEYRGDGTDSAESHAWRAGEHHDGMAYFGLGADGQFSATSSDRGLLVMNHEFATPAILRPRGAPSLPTLAEEALRDYYAHGISVVEVVKGSNGTWSYRRDSRFNRRLHALTECVLSGPAAGSPYMVTKFSPDGSRTRGTLNNCAHGVTPWHTYISCEENWAGYFRRRAADDQQRSLKERTALHRYRVRGPGHVQWLAVTPDTADNLYGRWDAEVRGATAAHDYRNAPNTFGWCVEVDPFDPASTPKKRTAMGRLAHEGAWFAKAVAGKPIVVYMGCDAANEYIYKYVSEALWDPADASRGMAAGDKYLDRGKLYVARFNADGTGQWLELSFGVNNITSSNPTYPFADAADVAVHTRLAADAAGGTKMDRPEWGAVDPVTGAVYMTLTKSGRPLADTDPANPRHYNDRAQRGNPNGHIIRWIEPTPEATTFDWDIFLFGARASADPNNVNLSGLTADNDFSGPDGVWFSQVSNICWIATDDSAFTDVTNCMLLAALPGAVGDGGTRTITNTDANNQTGQVTTHVGAPLGTRLRRFLVGPRDCEITGMCETPDGQTLFVNIQHPGERPPAEINTRPDNYTSHWPDGGQARPRSATIAIQKIGGGVVGL